MTTDKLQQAVSVAALHGNKILLVKRMNEPAKGQWAFPGGRVEAGETLKEAAKRELKEECALSAKTLSKLASYTLGAYFLTVFRATHVSGELTAQSDAEQAGFFTRADMADMDLTPSTRELAERLLKEM